MFSTYWHHGSGLLTKRTENSLYPTSSTETSASVPRTSSVPFSCTNALITATWLLRAPCPHISHERPRSLPSTHTTSAEPQSFQVRICSRNSHWQDNQELVLMINLSVNESSYMGYKYCTFLVSVSPYPICHSVKQRQQFSFKWSGSFWRQLHCNPQGCLDIMGYSFDFLYWAF